jgi:hypothetical protein
MEKFIYKTKQEMGAEAAEHSAEAIKQAIEDKGEANIGPRTVKKRPKRTHVNSIQVQLNE